MKYLGIDYGTKKVGIAVSDALGTLAFPREVLPTDVHLTSALAQMIEKEGIEAVVVGESKDYAGNENAVAAAARTFADELHTCAAVPIYFEDERLTSVQAQQHSRPSLVDAAAAALILQTFLDKQRQTG